MPHEVFVDAAECTGCEYCADALPEVFVMTEGDVSTVHDAGGADEARIREVIDNCPAECIHWR